MSIGIQSIPEMYTLLIGWDLYDKLWDLLTKTGVAFLPFIALVLKNVARAYSSHSAHQAGPSALRNMEFNLIVTLLVIVFAVSPCVPLNVHSVSYTPMCNEDKTVYAGNTGTTYDNAFAVPNQDVRLPMWWYAVISVSAGLTSAANTFVGCVPDLRKMVSEVDMTAISDPALKQELQDFENTCFMPARMQFTQDRETNQQNNINVIQGDISKYGVEDTEWLGSHSFDDTYYQNLKSNRAVAGFLYDPQQDINAETNQANPPTYGTPTCHDWWNDSDNGLKTRVFQALPKSFSDEFKNFMNTDKSQDDVVKRIIVNSEQDGYAGHVNPNANDTLSDYGISHALAAVGIWYQQVQEYPKLYAAAEAAPILQALILLMIYVFLPFAMVFSSYSVKNIVTGGVFIFSLIFWDFIWHLVSWTDHALMQAMYSDWFARQGAGATLTDLIIASLIISAPLLWFAFMGVMGVSAGDIVSGISMGINKMGNSGNAIDKAAKVADVAKTVIATLG